MGLGSILSFGGKLIDAIFTDKADKDKAKKALALAQLERNAELQKLAYERENELITARREAIVADAKGNSWIQRNWRPLVMLTFLILISAHWFGFTPEHLSDEEVIAAYDMMKLGLAGFVVGEFGVAGVKQFKNLEREKRMHTEAKIRAQ